MSEEILRALMHLFALITKQDGGIGEKELEYVKRFLVQQIGVDSSGEYLQIYRETAGESEEQKLTSVLDSVKVLKLCKQISKTINQRQKVVVLVRILELVNAEYKLSEQRMGIIRTVADIFRINKDEYESIFTFVTTDRIEDLNQKNHLVVSKQKPDPDDLPLVPEDKAHLAHQYYIRGLEDPIFFTRVPSVELYFMKYSGEQECFLNGLSIHAGIVYLFASGSSLRLPVGQPILYSDIASKFKAEFSEGQIMLEADNLSYVFPDKITGLDGISFTAQQGNLVGILGSSGSGKTTLLNVLAGMYKPTAGDVRINKLSINADASKLKGVSGYVPQDDLLIEELSVFDNLYFNARFCFGHLPDREVRDKVNETLANLGLSEKKDLRVGSVMNKTISGGQRKRLNIALELIREPSILFLDEPTSGLSSRDSEHVLDLLRELSLKGRLVFVVIHQPSSDLYKMFDQVIILDEGGKMVYYGNPMEAVIHFKKADHQVNAWVGECQICGNVNPELIFNTIEALQVDDYGHYTDQRKVSPQTWEQIFQEEQTLKKPKAPEELENPSPPPVYLDLPGWFKQFIIYLKRDVKSKISNPQYMWMTMLVSPILAFILAFIIRHIADPTSRTYIFRENENIPIFIFMALIVALFLGLILGAEEIFKDRKILKREKFLHLSRSSYLLAKIGTLVSISAIQTITFVLVANEILQIRDMTFPYWLALFSTAVCANMIGLLISSAFNSAVTIYIVIPLVMIPMMVLSGAMFSFEKLNRSITTVDKVPLIAELMPTKWSYEALMVHQFKANEFEKNFYDDEKQVSINNFKSAYLLPELEQRFHECIFEFREKGNITTSAAALEVLRNEIFRADPLVKDISFKEDELFPHSFNEATIAKTRRFLAALKKHYISQFSIANKQKERRLGKLMEDRRDLYFSMLNRYHNEAVSDQVKRIYEKNQIIESRGRLYQQIDPIFLDPEASRPGIRSHFFAPRKYFMGRYIETFAFNIGFIWFLTFVLYLLLYFNLGRRHG